MATVTVIILAKNEEQHMKDCIASAQFADEVLLIDDGSTDKTVEIAEFMGGPRRTSCYEWRLVSTTTFCC